MNYFNYKLFKCRITARNKYVSLINLCSIYRCFPFAVHVVFLFLCKLQELAVLLPCSYIRILLPSVCRQRVKYIYLLYWPQQAFVSSKLIQSPKFISLICLRKMNVPGNIPVAQVAVYTETIERNNTISYKH